VRSSRFALPLLCLATGCRQILGLDDLPDRKDAAIDVPTFQCADDSALGPNDSIGGAFQTPVATQQQMLTLAGLAICPAGDKDHYKVEIPASGPNLEVVADWDGGAPISVSILNAGGAAISNGVALSNNVTRACVTNLPAGTYYALAFAAATVENNYRLTIAIVPDCS
jgi:hypothetical protein